MSSFDLLHRYLELMWYTYIHTNKMLIHIKKKKNFKEKNQEKKIHDGRLERWIQDLWTISCIAIRIRSQIWTPAITEPRCTTNASNSSSEGFDAQVCTRTHIHSHR